MLKYHIQSKIENENYGIHPSFDLSWIQTGNDSNDQTGNDLLNDFQLAKLKNDLLNLFSLI